MTDPTVTINGEEWHKYGAEYLHEGNRYSFSFFARSDEEAQSILRSIRTTAVECDRIYGEISADVPLAGWRVRFTCWWRNLISKTP